MKNIPVTAFLSVALTIGFAANAHAESDPAVLAVAEANAAEAKVTGEEEGEEETDEDESWESEDEGDHGREQAKTPTRLSGEWPEPAPRISLNLKKESVIVAVEKIANAAGWGLALTPPDKPLAGQISIQVKDQPATEVLTIALEAGNLEAKLMGNTLIVRPAEPDQHHIRADLDMPFGDVHVKVKRALHNIHRHKSKRHGSWDDRVAIGSSVRVDAGETVGDAVSVGGSVNVAGHVRGDAVSVGGSVVLEPGAEVDGDAVAMGGELTVPDGATVHGDRVSMGGSVGGMVSNLVRLGNWYPGIPAVLLGILGTLVRAILLLVIGLLLIAFMPEHMGNIRGYLRQNPGSCVLGGLGLIVGVFPVCVLMAITIIGIPLIPVALLLLLAMFIMGLTAFAMHLGHRLPLFGEQKSAGVALILGVVILTLVDLIPLAGTAIVTIIGFVSAGAVLLSRFGKAKLAVSDTVSA